MKEAYMKYSSLLFLVLVCLVSFNSNASQRDPIKPGSFDPEIGARLFMHGRLNPIARCSLFAPKGIMAKEIINRYTNYLIPSKPEAIEKILDATVCRNTVVSKLLAYLSCTTLEAYRKYPQILSEVHNKHLDQKRNNGAQLAVSDLKDQNAPASVKKESKELALGAAGKQITYDCCKLYAIGYIRSKVDPYLHKITQKSHFLKSINSSNSNTALVVRYAANRFIYGTLDMGCDKGYDFLKKIALTIR